METIQPIHKDAHHPPIYKDAHFTITKEIFISGNTRFALPHLCSIKLEKAAKQIPYTLAVLELILIGTGLSQDFQYHSYLTLLGFLGLIASAAVYIFRKPVHKLYLTFSSGEKQVIQETNYDYLQGVANAFSRALS